MSSPQVIQFPVVPANTTAPNATSAEVQEGQTKSNSLNLDAAHPVTGLKYGGFIPMRCAIFLPEILQVLSPGEAILFLYMTFLQWRYPLRPGCIRAALPYLAKGTGIGCTSIHTYLGRLEDLGFLECLERNYSEGNVYRVRDIAVWDETKPPELPRPKIEAPEEEGSKEERKEKTIDLPADGKIVDNSSKKEQSEIQHAEICTGAVQDLNGRSSDSEREQFKNRTEDYSSLPFSKLSYSLSQEIPESILNYLSSIKAHKKRKSERQNFLILQKDYSLQEIADSLDYLLGYGVPGSGEPCHSPMAYLSHAMDAVLALVQAAKEKARAFEDQRQQREELERKDREAKAAEDAEFQRRVAAFDRAFPTEEAKKRQLESFSKLYPSLPMTGQALRNLAIIAWSSDERQPSSDPAPGAVNALGFNPGSLFKTFGR